MTQNWFPQAGNGQAWGMQNPSFQPWNGQMPAPNANPYGGQFMGGGQYMGGQFPNANAQFPGQAPAMTGGGGSNYEPLPLGQWPEPQVASQWPHTGNMPFNNPQGSMYQAPQQFQPGSWQMQNPMMGQQPYIGGYYNGGRSRFRKRQLLSPGAASAKFKADSSGASIPATTSSTAGPSGDNRVEVPSAQGSAQGAASNGYAISAGAKRKPEESSSVSVEQTVSEAAVSSAEISKDTPDTTTAELSAEVESSSAQQATNVVQAAAATSSVSPSNPTIAANEKASVGAAKSNTHMFTLIGGIVGAVAALVIIVALVIRFRRRRALPIQTEPRDSVPASTDPSRSYTFDHASIYSSPDSTYSFASLMRAEGQENLSYPGENRSPRLGRSNSSGDPSLERPYWNDIGIFPKSSDNDHIL